MSSPRFNVDPLSDSFIRLIDIMFGLTITQGFVIYRESIISPELSVKNISLVLVYSTIILSWVYYHKSILHYPYNKSRWSRLRLFFDITILVLYAYLVFVGQDLSKILLGLIAIFSVYIIDGMIRICEWHDRKVSKPWLSAFFATIFALELYVYSLKNVFSWVYSSWVILFISLACVFGYRLARSILSYPSLIFVGVDIDGVLGEQVPPVLQRMKSKGKAANATKENIIDWNFQLDDTDISKEIEEALLDPTFVLEMPVVQGSTSAMQQIYKKYHIVIVTSRPIDTEKETKDWLKKNFKFHEFINTRECGKNSLGLDLLIDDNLDNVKAFASSGGCALLFSQPWNLKTDDKDLENLIRARKTVRCENWDEILKSITNIEKKLRR